jgi:hypothetical protein
MEGIIIVLDWGSPLPQPVEHDPAAEQPKIMWPKGLGTMLGAIWTYHSEESDTFEFILKTFASRIFLLEGRGTNTYETPLSFTRTGRSTTAYHRIKVASDQSKINNASSCLQCCVHCGAGGLWLINLSYYFLKGLINSCLWNNS